MNHQPQIVVVHSPDSPCLCHASFLQALNELSFRTLLVPVEELGCHRSTVGKAALTFEHAETYRGSGELRPLVRLQIEAWGGRVAGTPCVAALVADDKIATVNRLAAQGLRVPKSALMTHHEVNPDLPLPWVLKRPFEHGSRGLALATSAASGRRQIRKWLDEGDAVVLAQELIVGRELAVSLVETRRGPRVLPIVEIELSEPTYSVETKWGTGPLPIVPAILEAKLQRRIEKACIKAFTILGLRDYARFDLRLDARGVPCFLEANARPSVEDGTELRLACELAGMSFEVFLLHVIISAARRHRHGSLVRLAEERMRERQA